MTDTGATTTDLDALRTQLAEADARCVALMGSADTEAADAAGKVWARLYDALKRAEELAG